MTDNERDGGEDLYAPAERTAAAAQVRALRDQARRGGLRFEAYLPPELADWVLEKVEAGVFASPSEAVFVFMGLAQDLEPHGDLRRELDARQMAAAEAGPLVSSEVVAAELRRWAAERRPEPAVWTRAFIAP